MKRAQSRFRAKRDLIVDLLKPQPLDGVFFAHDPLHDVRNRFADVVICNFALDNVIAVRIVYLATADNDQIQPFHARTVKLQKLKLLCSIFVPFVGADNSLNLCFCTAAFDHSAASGPTFSLRLNIRGIERKAKITADFGFENVRLLSNQDTLFCAPLPEKEREKDGFLGPRGLAPRRPTAQYYRHCQIAGDIDFIFGGADALFEQCTIRTVNNHLPVSYVTAPSGRADGLGFVLWDCDFFSDNCPAGTVFLGRPWRPTGKTAVLDCRLGAHIAPEGFSPWQSRTDSDLASFAEAGSTGEGAAARGAWVKQLDSQQAEELLRCARKLCRPE